MPRQSEPLVILFNKPFRVLSDRDPNSGKRSVADYVPFADVHPAGRLDYDSEGLLVLTNDGELQHRIIHPRFKLSKTYMVQVEGRPSRESIERLIKGVNLKDGLGRANSARAIPQPDLPPRDPPVQDRADIGSTWLEMVMTEGRKRQVRRMTAAISHPALRLVRIAVGPWGLGGLRPGEWTRARKMI